MDMIIRTRRQFMLLLMLVTTIIIVTALVAVYWLTGNSQEVNNRQQLNSIEKIRITGNGTVSFGEDSTDAYVVERTFADISTNSFTMLVNNQGKVIFTLNTDKDDQTQELLQEAADIAWQGENYSKVKLDGRIWQYLVAPAETNITVEDEQVPADWEDTYQIRFIDITESQKTLHTLALTLSVIGLLLLIFFFFFSRYFSDRAIRPLSQVLKKQQQFVADASHELKTPVSIIKANCSVLFANEEATIASQKEWLDNIVTGADRMTNLIQGLIAMAKIEGTESEIIKSEILLEKEINESLDMLDLSIEEKSLTVEISGCNVMIWNDPDRVRQVINIILDNAIKYCNEGGLIRIVLTLEKKYLCLSVFNTGSGIAKEDLDKIFDRFYRVEGERSPNGSYGLGLAIAQTVMRQLGGAISAESTLGQGATFSLRFPTAH